MANGDFLGKVGQGVALAQQIENTRAQKDKNEQERMKFELQMTDKFRKDTRGAMLAATPALRKQGLMRVKGDFEKLGFAFTEENLNTLAQDDSTRAATINGFAMVDGFDDINKTKATISIFNALSGNDPQVLLDGLASVQKFSSQRQAQVAKTQAAQRASIGGLRREATELETKGDNSLDNVRNVSLGIFDLVKRSKKGDFQTGAADILLMKGLNQFYDTQRVTDGEIKLIAGAEGAVGRFQRFFVNLKEGVKLTPAQRQDIATVSKSMLVIAEQRATSQFSPLQKSIEAQGLPSDQILSENIARLLKTGSSLVEEDREQLGFNISETAKKAAKQFIPPKTTAEAQSRIGILTDDQIRQAANKMPDAVKEQWRAQGIEPGSDQFISAMRGERPVPVTKESAPKQEFNTIEPKKEATQ